MSNFQAVYFRGKDGARQVFTQLLADVPEASWEVDSTFADDVLYLEWKATSISKKASTRTKMMTGTIACFSWVLKSSEKARLPPT